MTAVAIDSELDTTSYTGNPRHSHIVDRGDDPRPAHALITEAMVSGTPLTALCGYTWVPSRDPRKLQICKKCLEIFEFAKDFRGAA
jgi:hypothetical protein